MNDWNQLDRYDRIQRLNKNYSQWQEYSAKSTIIGFAVLIFAISLCVYVVLCFEPETEFISTAPNHTSIILHEQSRGER